jgi:glycine cleavage system H protein
MKELNELILPEDVRFTDEHEWARQEGDHVKVGISDYAQDQLGDIVFVELPETGSVLNRGEEFGTVESVKTVSEIYMPIGGQIIAVNEELADHPEYVNTDPYGKGWMIEIKPSDPEEMKMLLDRDAYLKLLEG